PSRRPDFLAFCFAHIARGPAARRSRGRAARWWASRVRHSHGVKKENRLRHSRRGVSAPRRPPHGNILRRSGPMTRILREVWLFFWRDLSIARSYRTDRKSTRLNSSHVDI